MIALAGLGLATGRYDDARKILETFARFIDQGIRKYGVKRAARS
jgi:glycogen debranching enzyme